jgi:hypothetical protein
MKLERLITSSNKTTGKQKKKWSFRGSVCVYILHTKIGSLLSPASIYVQQISVKSIRENKIILSAFFFVFYNCLWYYISKILQEQSRKIIPRQFSCIVRKKTSGLLNFNVEFVLIIKLCWLRSSPRNKKPGCRHLWEHGNEMSIHNSSLR